MVFLSVTLLTFVQFLWVLLWIGIALVVLSVLAGAYLYYRKTKTPESDDLASDNETTADAGAEMAQPSPAGEKAYQGLLWLKGKYEEDIEQADTKYYELREEFKKLEKKYIDLRVHSINVEQQLHSMREGYESPREIQQEALQQEALINEEVTDPAIETGFPESGLAETGSFKEHEPVPVSQAEWEILNDRLTAETLKVKDLESRLASSSQLLMKMYKELASSLQASNTFYKTKAHENRVKGLVKEFDAAAATGTATGERKISSWVESPAVDEDGQLEQLG